MRFGTHHPIRRCLRTAIATCIVITAMLVGPAHSSAATATDGVVGTALCTYSSYRGYNLTYGNCNQSRSRDGRSGYYSLITRRFHATSGWSSLAYLSFYFTYGCGSGACFTV